MAYNDFLIDDVQEYLVLICHSTRGCEEGRWAEYSSSSATLFTAYV